MRSPLTSSLVHISLAASFGTWLITSQVITSAQSEDPYTVTIPSPPGLSVTYLYGSQVPGARDTQAFAFSDGRLAVDAGTSSMYSSDGGRTWRVGPRAPATFNAKVAFDFGDGEIVSFGRTTTRRGILYGAGLFRSTDSWQTTTSDIAWFDTPLAVPFSGDNGVTKPNEGLLMHHGLVRLHNGDLLATMYGNYAGDVALVEGVPAAWNMRKFRALVVSSSDRGRFWSRPVTVAYQEMVDPFTGTHVPAVAREGFNEADLTRAPNGDLVMVMRTGGRTNVEPQPPPTPLYLSRSDDEGASWSTPIAITDRGTNPSLVTLLNGVMVLSYAGSGEWITFSIDSGQTWTTPHQLSERDSYTSVVPLAPESFVVFFFPSSGPGGVRAAAFRAVHRGLPPRLQLAATPAIASGTAATVTWTATNARGCMLSGGQWAEGFAVSPVGERRLTGALTRTTTYTVRCESASDPGLFSQQRRTVTVQ